MTETLEFKVAIIGGGVGGCAVAKELASEFGDGVVLLERSDSIRSDNQTGRSSQVLHGGHLYDAGVMPKKAFHCVRGNAMAYPYCSTRDVPHARTGKLVAATNEGQEEYLEGVHQIAIANGVPRVRILSAQQVTNMQPSIRATKALYVPSSGIVDAVALAQALADDAESDGALLNTSQEVVSISPSHGGLLLHVHDHRNREEYDIKAYMVVNAAGLDAVRLAKQLDPSLPYISRVDRGEAACFSRKRPGCYVTMNVYRAPSGYYKDGRVADVPFRELLELVRENKATLWTDVHFTPTLADDGSLGDLVTVCPVKTPDVEPDDFGSGTGSSKPLKPMINYYERVHPMMKGLRLEYLSPHQAGNMVVLDRPDFVFHQDSKYPMLSLLGIGTPGLTSSMSLALEVKTMVDRVLH